MNPYYDHGGITLYHCAWEELLPTLLPASVGLFLVDPNYGTTQLAWDTPWDWPRFWRESNRACPPNALQVLFSAQPFTTDLINSNRKPYRYEVVWAKTLPTGFLDANRRPLRAHETLQVFCRAFGKSTYHPQMVPCAPTADHWGAPNLTQARHYGKYTKVARLGLIAERFPPTYGLSVTGNGKRASTRRRSPCPCWSALSPVGAIPAIWSAIRALGGAQRRAPPRTCIGGSSAAICGRSAAN